jgi:hypothetical protein
VRAAALDVLRQVTSLSTKFDLEVALRDPDQEVRYEAIRAARAREPDILTPHLTQLAQDPSYSVRYQLIAEAETFADRAVLDAIASGDADAILRRMATLALQRLN